MNRYLLILVLAAIAPLLASPTKAQQQPPTVASLIAERQQMEERHKQLRAAYEDLVDALELQRRQLEELRDEVDQMKRTPQVDESKFATKSDVARIERALKDLNDGWNAKREEDRKVIVDQLKQLKQSTQSSPSPSKPSTPSKTYSTYYEYKIESGDTLTTVIKAYNESGIPVTLDQVKGFNPGLNVDKIVVGQVIKIPDPR